MHCHFLKGALNIFIVLCAIGQMIEVQATFTSYGTCATASIGEETCPSSWSLTGSVSCITTNSFKLLLLAYVETGCLAENQQG